MIGFDFLLGIVGIIYTILPLNLFALSLNNLVFLIFGIVAAILYQIQLYRAYTGGVSFYLSLPIPHTQWIILLTLFMIIPIICIISFELGLLLFLKQFFPLLFGEVNFFERTYYLILITILLKIISLPIYILYKKHIGLIPVFLFLLLFVYFSVSIIQEIFFWWFPNPVYFISISFVSTVFFLCIRIINSARVM
jgi:hypothetical protein